MKVFMIGASGHIGRGVTRALLGAGHQVIALARSAESRARLPAQAASVSGDIADLDLLRRESAQADAVIYNAIMPGEDTAAQDLAIQALLETLEGSGKTFIVTSGMGVYAGAKAVLKDEETDLDHVIPQQRWRVNLERTLVAWAGRGVRTVVIRPSWIYGVDAVNRIFPALIAEAKAKGRAFYVSEGDMLPAAHVDDLADAYRLALEKAEPGDIFNIASLLPTKDVARAIGRAAGLEGEPETLTPAQAIEAVGPGPASAIGGDLKVSSYKAAFKLGWSPSRLSLLAYLTHGESASTR